MATQSIGVPAENLNLARVGDGYIELRNRRFAAVYQVTGGVNPQTEDQNSVLAKISTFENAIRQLRPNEEIQIILRRVPADDMVLIDNFKSTCRPEAAEGFQNNFVQYYEGFISDFVKNRRLCDYEVFLLFSIDFNLKPLTESAVNLFSKIFGSGDSKPKSTEELVQQLEEVIRRAKAWVNVLGVSGVIARELKESEIYRLLYSEINLLNFKGDTSGFKNAAPVAGGPGSMETLRETLCVQPILTMPSSLKIGERLVRTMTITNFPNVQGLTHFLSQFLQQNEDFKVTVFIRGLDQELGKSIIRGQMRIDQATSDEGTTPNYDAHANMGNRSSVLAAIAQRETGLARISMFISVFGDNEKDLKNNYENFVSRFEGIHRYDGYYQQEELFFSSLPLCSNITRDRVERLQTTTDIANCWPFFIDSLTFDKGVLVGHTAGNQPLMLNPWSSVVENYNIGIFGSPGSGKSFGTQLILTRLMPRAPEVMVIDRSGCYKTLCDVAGGEYIYFDLKCDKHINAFDCPEESYVKRGVVSEDQEETVLGYLTTLLTETGEKALKNAETAVLLEAIKKTYKTKYDETKGREGGPQFPLLRDFRKVISDMAKDKNRSESARELSSAFADILSQFVEDGTYANITDRETNIDRNSKFIVFDTSLGAKREKIKALVTYITSTYCFARARLCQKEGKFPIIVIDEFWDLLSFPAGQDFADILSRTSRHLSLCTIYATQKIADCMATEKAKTALDNAATKIFMKLGDADRALCVKAFELGDKEAAIISDLFMLKGVHSKCFIKSTARQGLAFICPDPVSYWISTSHPLDKPRREKYMNHFNPDNNVEGTWRAIYQLVEDEFYNRDPEFLRS